MSQRELGRLLLVNRSAMVKVVDSLEAKDWCSGSATPAIAAPMPCSPPLGADAPWQIGSAT